MTRQAGSVYVEVDWDLSDDGGAWTMKDAGVRRIVAIPAADFNDHFTESPDEWVADWLSDEYGWLVNGWCFA